MIKLSNGRLIEYVIASGALAFDGKGWPWERPLVWTGHIKPQLFTTVTKTLTLNPRKGNLRMWKPWTCIRTIPGGTVNKVGLTNPGFQWWCEKVAPTIDFEKYPIAVSLWGTPEECVEMAKKLNSFKKLVALVFNDSCPNTGHGLTGKDASISTARRIKEVSIHPLLHKLSEKQDLLGIATGVHGIVEAIKLNSVEIERAFPKGDVRPLWRLEQKVGGGGGGVSGEPAQRLNWIAVEAIAQQGLIPVIAPSIKRYEDMKKVRMLGAKAVSFGAIHLPDHPIWRHPLSIWTNPCKPTKFVEEENS